MVNGYFWLRVTYGSWLMVNGEWLLAGAMKNDREP